MMRLYFLRTLVVVIVWQTSPFGVALVDAFLTRVHPRPIYLLTDPVSQRRRHTDMCIKEGRTNTCLADNNPNNINDGDSLMEDKSHSLLDPSSVDDTPATTNTTHSEQKHHDSWQTYLENVVRQSYHPPAWTNDWMSYLKLQRLHPGSFENHKTNTTLSTRTKGHSIPSLLRPLSANYVSPAGQHQTAAIQPNQSSQNTPPVSLTRRPVSSFGSSILIDKKPTDPLTLQDLESILMNNRFVRESDLRQEFPMSPALSPDNVPVYGVGSSRNKRQQNQIIPSVPQSSSTYNLPISPQQPKSPKATGGVAFPQPSVLSYKHLKWGTAVSASVCGMIVGISLVPNLWLVGAALGGVYGSSVADKLAETQQTPEGLVPSTLVSIGRKVARTYLTVRDSVVTLFFMYKTGQLSYEYYQRYAKLDERFEIQKKVDAWNARFVEGKIAFDKWEQENEIGRKLLAGLRTAWLVEERSLKKKRFRRKSRYRVVQFVYDAEFWLRRAIRSTWKTLTGRGDTRLREFFQGLRQELSETRRERLGPAIVALFAGNLIGAFFTISPTFLSILAIIIGFSWPTWTTEFYTRVERLIRETRARGRGEIQSLPFVGRSNPIFYDKSRYHFYTRKDGTKQFYRTGKSWFTSGFSDSPDAKRAQDSSSPWPWSKLDTRKTQNDKSSSPSWPNWNPFDKGS